MTLQLLTATGCRPAAWALCERWMARQTYAGAVRWVIVDDGAEPQPITFDREGWELVVIRPWPRWEPGQNTQARNLLAGLAEVTDAHPLAVIEDDDWYAPDYLQWVSNQFAEHKAHLIGESFARYYHVGRRIGRQLDNRRHASLCSTATCGPGTAVFRRVARRRAKFIDLELWRSFHGKRRLVRGAKVCGIKGLPGREGIGAGHRDSFCGQQDPHEALLCEWVGDDAEAYLHGN
jgi:hypothetical protein